MKPTSHDIQMVWRAVFHAVRMLDQRLSTGQRARLRTNILTQRAKVRGWMRAYPDLGPQLDDLAFQIGNVIARINRGDSEGELEGMLNFVPAPIGKPRHAPQIEGDSHDRRPPQFNRTAIAHRAQASKRAASIQRATLRQQMTKRPSQRAIRAYTGQLLYVPPGMGSHQSVIDRLRSLMWAQWVSLVPMIVAIAAALAKSATGNPGPALFGNIVSEIMIRRGVIQPSERSVWAGFLGGLWSAPMPRSMVVGITAGLIALRHGHRATNMIAAHGKGGRNPEAEALAAFEMAAS